MSNYNNLKSSINNNIYENQTQQITGTVLNAILNEMTNALGAGYQFAGVATVGMTPSEPDARIFYLAGEGIYTSFDGIQVPAGKLGILKWDSRWHLETIDGLGSGGANLTGYVTVASTDDLPDEGVATLGYLCGENLYLYVGEGGDTKEGKYQNCGSFRGPQGDSVQDVEQTQTSLENGGVNKIKFTLSNGISCEFQVRNGTTSSGLFPTLAALQAAYPSPVVGQYAFVGSGFPADIYVCTTAGTWTDSGEDYDGDNVDLTDYATKAEVNELEHKVDGNPFTKMNNNELSTNYVENSYVDTSNGNFVSYNGWARSGYINVSLFESLVINTNRASVYNGFYDKDKSFIRSFSLIVGNNNVSVPDNACFIVISNTSADVKTTAIVIGKYRYATKNDIDQSTTMFRSVSSKTLPGLTVDNYGKILSVSSSYYILYYKAEADCVVRLSYKRADSYVYDGKIFIAPESSLVVNAYVSVLTQVSQNASSDKMYTLSAGQCLCVTYRAGDMANFYLGESVLEQAKLIDSSLPKYGIEGVNLVRINAIQNNSIVNGTTGKIATDNNGWRAIEIDFCQDDVRIFMNKIWSGYYSFVDANGNVLLVQGNNYNLYWGYKIPKGAVKGRFSINANVSDADISSYCYISYGRPLMQDEISNRVSFKNSFSYAKIERPTDYNGVDITAFMKILCIGDSITRGYFNSTSGGVNIPGMSYPDNLARITGCEVTNLGDSGESTASWWAAHQNDTELTGAKCVIIELGINDDPSTLDTVTKDAMDAIIAKLKTENQKVKIFLSGIPSGKSYPARLDTDSYYVKDQWLRNYYNTYFAEDAQVFFLDIARYTHICEKKAETYDDYNQGHLSEYGYWRLAKDYANYISFLMYNSDNTFKEIQFIGTDYSRT